jgi:hypothetical protein
VKEPGSKPPSEGFNSRLRARGLHTHYWSEVRRPAPRKGSTAASGYSGFAPTHYRNPIDSRRPGLFPSAREKTDGDNVTPVG